MNSSKPQVNEYLTTGQAATLCSVTSDAVLKWIKAGKLPANRTPGGHYRIRRNDILSILSSERTSSSDKRRSRSFQYCWEYNSKTGEINQDCLQCLVFQAKAYRCYEMRHLPTGHARSFCAISCEECDYYTMVQQQRPNILFVTNQDSLRESLKEGAKDADFNIRFTDCEYSCSMLVESYRPDYISIDCSLGRKRAMDFANQLIVDPRIPFIRVILVGDKHEFPNECDKEVFAFIERPIKIDVLQRLIKTLSRSSNSNVDEPLKDFS
ncbi:excisionase family DNA-binding protein [bacterium]|nr:excisionase family DNA-binding protein [bacterium]